MDYLGASSGGGVSQEDINTAVNNYLTEHPVQSGATAEQAAQIEANKTAIGDENEYQSLLARAKAELESFKRRYATLTELESVFEAIENI